MADNSANNTYLKFDKLCLRSIETWRFSIYSKWWLQNDKRQFYLLSLENDPDLSPMTPGFLGPVTTLFNCTNKQQNKI